MKQSQRQHLREKQNQPSLYQISSNQAAACIALKPLRRHGSKRKSVTHAGLPVIHEPAGPISGNTHSLYYYQMDKEPWDGDNLGEDLKVVLNELCHREVADYYLRQTL